MENIKWLFYILFFSFLFACHTKKASKDQDSYQVIDKRITIYENDYDNNHLIKSSITSTTINPYGQSNDYSQELYYYDEQGFLIKKETYDSDISSAKNELKAINTYSLKSDEYVLFRNFPNDTANYNSRKKNDTGLLVEEYSKTYFSDYQSESINTFQYDEQNRLVLNVNNDLITQEEVIRTFEYNIIADTSFTKIYRNGTLETNIKEFKDKDTKIKVSINCENHNIDSTFTSKSKIYSIYYDHTDNSKIVDILLLDEWGNPTKQEYQLFIKKQ